MKISSPRTFLEVRIGDRQSVEVILHVRRADIAWFNQNDVFSELLLALQTSILPRKCTKEIETNFYKYESIHHGRTRPPEHIGPGGFPLCLGTSTVAKGPPTKPAATGKRRRGPTKATAKVASKKPPPVPENRSQKTERDTFYASTTASQIVYRLEELTEDACATLLFSDANPKECTSGNHILTALQKLTQRILLWCYPRELFDIPSSTSINDGDNDTNNDDDGLPSFLAEGFVRPEFIPLSSLFAPPVLKTHTESKEEAAICIAIDGDE